ncbi:lactoylglutathione lyase family protein [Spongiibacter sp. IMCC21906]|uniref:VOC family protein n=1 Tax=Spongiibacter sp. IMCC21906 TaxID=1620392 RepID=UPI00062DE978|nr:VOC family protein [Spongiibacter sp. IMCC21906]AKH68003.1 lactoylglutathione lyase family protein [Spongiibacter sp. IMCC21906]
MPAHETINYLQFPVRDLDASKQFFSSVFAWSFTDYGPDYTTFSAPGIEGGFFRSPLASNTETGAVLVVFYSQQIENTLAKVIAAGGEVIKPIFSFPGGRRFHFKEPSGNELAVWSEPEV